MVTDDLPDPFMQLVTVGQRPDGKIRPVLMRVLVDMFVSKPHHTATELTQFEEMMAHLLDDADDETRLTVAEQLSRHPQTPRSLIARFMAERGEIAAKVLARAEMDGRALSAAAVFGTSLMAQAVARRSDIDAVIARSLAERPEWEVLCALVDNRSAPIDRSLFRYLARRAQSLPILATRLLERGEAGETVSLFLSAPPARRAELIAAARRQDLGSTGRPNAIDISPEALAGVVQASENPGLEGLDSALAHALKCTAHDIARLLDDPHGEPLAVALAAIGVPSNAAARIFILGDPTIGHSYGKVKGLVALVNTLPARAASKLLAAMLGREAEAPRRMAAPAIEDAGVRAEPAQVRREKPSRTALPRRSGRGG